LDPFTLIGPAAVRHECREDYFSARTRALTI
jgi:hypothetical protein